MLLSEKKLVSWQSPRSHAVDKNTKRSHSIKRNLVSSKIERVYYYLPFWIYLKINYSKFCYYKNCYYSNSGHYSNYRYFTHCLLYMGIFRSMSGITKYPNIVMTTKMEWGGEQTTIHIPQQFMYALPAQHHHRMLVLPILIDNLAS